LLYPKARWPDTGSGSSCSKRLGIVHGHAANIGTDEQRVQAVRG
jgi:hypothetical protein